jgi:tyrosinase
MGPLQNHLAGVKPNPQIDGLGYNPRCMSRDISKQAASETTDEKVAFLIKNSTNIRSFQDLLQNFIPGSVGIHSGGHYTIGGDAGSDLYNSPADPAFFLHHVSIPSLIQPLRLTRYRAWWTRCGGFGRIWM